MDTVTVPLLREQLIDRQQRLEAVVGAVELDAEVTRLLSEVDSALRRMDDGSFGICEVCHEPVETDRLIADPLVRFCIDHLTRKQRNALEQDMEMAALIQRELLPKKTVRFDGWEVSYHYQAAGPVSGDYCDLVLADSGHMYFMLGDVSGKGVAASMLMSHLHALFRSLIPLDLPLQQLMERASRVFCESTLPTHYATLVCGKASTTGEVEICNAGHLPPLWLRRAEVECVESTGLPIGVFCEEHFKVDRIQLEPGETLLLYTDGLTEAQDGSGAEYGRDRLADLLGRSESGSCEELISACMGELTAYRETNALADDLTIMAIRRRV
jgi:sigma-B regulation protein RsbU (phosphoserine phosphatase)